MSRKVLVLLAGTLDAHTEAMLASAENRRLLEEQRIRRSDGFHDDLSEYRVFKAADAVWLGYSDNWFGSSGVLYQAGSLGLPVVAASHGVIGWLTRRYEVGVTIDPTKPRLVCSAIASLMLDDERRERLGANGKKLSGRHTKEKFGTAVCDAIAIGTKSQQLAAAD